MARNGKQLGAAVVGLAEIEELLTAHLQDEGNGGECLGIVDCRRLAIKTERCRERRLETRLPFLAFNGLQQRRLFATNVGTVAMVGEQFEIESRSKDILTYEPSSPSLIERFLEAFVDFPDFTRT